MTAALSTSVLTTDPTGARYVEIVARLRNSGTEKAVMPIAGPAMTLVRLEFDKNGDPREAERHMVKFWSSVPIHVHRTGC